MTISNPLDNSESGNSTFRCVEVSEDNSEDELSTNELDDDEVSNPIVTMATESISTCSLLSMHSC